MQIVHTHELLVNLKNRRSFPSIPLGRSEAQGECKGPVISAGKKIKFKKVTIVRRVRLSVRNEIMTSFHEQFATPAYYKNGNMICMK